MLREMQIKTMSITSYQLDWKNLESGKCQVLAGLQDMGSLICYGGIEARSDAPRVFSEPKSHCAILAWKPSVASPQRVLG